ncbi:hypothetical protein EDB92DRAFT_1831305 [Lactarius akahatsu]|uniref:Uncharacterized protein n=1 Tax=Lactarius akahatsu TaxID=416441 RepID=A0AAD4LR58_9AGAM|nr:hypothetical protein EDB92DRAFT_1831305 [Lactarius akahatsu]
MASTTCCSGIVGNSDLVGIGTRVNLYVTILLSAIVLPPPEGEEGPTTDLLDDLFANSIFYGLAVLITAVVQTIQKQLDLYHALFVTQVLICLVLLHLYGAKRYITRRDEERVSKFKMNITLAFQVLQVIILIPWALYVWIKDSRFGSQPECNHFVKYVFFFVTVRATVGWLRILAFVGLAACAVGLVFVLVMALKLQKLIEDIFRRESQASAENPSGPLGFVSDALDGVSRRLRSASDGLAGVPLVGPVLGLYATAAAASGTVVKAFSKLFPDPNMGVKQKLKHLKAKWEKRIKRVGRVFWVSSILAAIYSVVTMELIVHRNHPIIRKDTSENEWAFGQIASVILILPIVIDVLAVWFKRDEPSDTASGSSSTRPSEKQG